VKLVGLVGQRGGRVLLTTRIARVADQCHAVHYKLEVMREEESLRLLKSKARCDPERAFGDARDDMARAFCRLCGYLPLSLVLVGSMLGGCIGQGDWAGILETVQRRGLDSDAVVGLSIDRLEEERRACFLDIVLWREDEAISVEAFTRVWRVRVPELSDGEIGRMLAMFVSANLLFKSEQVYRGLRF
jgi:hypothetical protein